MFSTKCDVTQVGQNALILVTWVPASANCSKLRCSTVLIKFRNIEIKQKFSLDDLIS